MKSGLVIVEYKDLETHMNVVRDTLEPQCWLFTRLRHRCGGQDYIYGLWSLAFVYSGG